MDMNLPTPRPATEEIEAAIDRLARYQTKLEGQVAVYDANSHTRTRQMYEQRAADIGSVLAALIEARSKARLAPDQCYECCAYLEGPYCAKCSGGNVPELLTRLAALEAERWQPIESAPKDWTAILIWDVTQGRSEGYMPDGALKDGEHSYRSDDPRLKRYDDKAYAIGYWRPWGKGSWGNRNSHYVNPTHWQPLPASPLLPAARPNDE